MKMHQYKQFKTTCFICFEKFGRSLKDPDDIPAFLSNNMTDVLPEERNTRGVEHQNQAAGERNSNDGDDMMDTAVNENDDVDIMEKDYIEKDEDKMMNLVVQNKYDGSGDKMEAHETKATSRASRRQDKRERQKAMKTENQQSH